MESVRGSILLVIRVIIGLGLISGSALITVQLLIKVNAITFIVYGTF